MAAPLINIGKIAGTVGGAAKSAAPALAGAGLVGAGVVGAGALAGGGIPRPNPLRRPGPGGRVGAADPGGLAFFVELCGLWNPAGGGRCLWLLLGGGGCLV